MYELFLRIAEFVESLGYLGIFIMTFVEATFVPIPSEVTLIPAGYLVAKGLFNIWLLLLASVSGTVCGALFSYYTALYFGRSILLKYGKYLWLSQKQLEKIEKFFAKHGATSTFIGRMLPGVKHFIAFPAGLGKMNCKLFVLYSTAGATIWVSIIIAIGYFIGDNELLIHKYLKQLNIAIISMITLAIVFYLIKFRWKRK